MLWQGGVVSRGGEVLCNRLCSENVLGPTHTVECVNRWHPLTVKAGSTLLPPLPSSTPPNQPPTPARPLHLSPLCGNYRTVWEEEEEPSILFPSQRPPLAFTRTPPSSCTYANAVIPLHFTAVVFPSLFLAGWSFSSPSFKITLMHTCVCSMKAS